MISERQFLDGESGNSGQKATGQCPCLYGTDRTRCNFIDRPSLRGLIYEAESGQMDAEPDFRDMVFNVYWKYIDHEHRIRLGTALMNKAKVKKHAGHELGAREFTLTYSPQWCTDADARTLMVRCVERIMKYYRNEICELQVVGEVTKQGNSHIHGYYLLDGGRKITDKNFKRAYKYWNPKKKLGRRGHEGGHHEVVRGESDFKGYIDKCPDAWYKYSYVRGEHKHAKSDDTTSSSQYDTSGEESDCTGTDQDS